MSRRGILRICAAAALLALGAAVLVAVQQSRRTAHQDTAEEATFTLLHRAAQKGLLNSARVQLAKGRDANIRDHVGMTPLHYAACEGQDELVLLLLEAGGLVNARGERGLTPLHMAAAMGHMQAAQLLLDSAADPEAADEAGLTPLHHAAGEGHLDVCRLLLARGAAANARDNQGWTPFQHASYEGHRAISNLLLSSGAEDGAPGSEGGTASRAVPPRSDARGAAAPSPSAMPAGRAAGTTSAPDQPLRRAPPNVILIVVDALRPDRLGCYGYQRDTSPNLDALASEGTVFTDAMAQGPLTMISVPVLLTGRRSGASGMVRVRWDEVHTHARPGPHVPTLAELLRDRGYETACVSAHALLSSEGGLARGFDHLDVSCARKAELNIVSAPDVNLCAYEWLQTRDAPRRPFFLSLHYMEPHAQYRPPAGFCIFGRPGYTARDTERNVQMMDLVPYPPYGVLKPGQRVTDEILSAQGLSHRDIERLSDLYDGEVLCSDHYVGQLMQRLKALGLYEDALIIVTADHGEAFLEHRTLQHGQALYQELLHVPLIMRGPGISPGRQIHDLVEVVDIAPTILEAAGAPVATEMCGRSFYQALLGRAAIADDTGTADLPGRMRAFRSGPLKLIVSTESVELYDLAEDPGETADLAPSRPADVERLRAMLDDLMKRHPPAVETRESPTPRQLEALKALGYLR